MSEPKLKAPTLADQYKSEVYALEGVIAAAIEDFTVRTGFVVKEILPSFHDYRSSGNEPYYAVMVKVDV